MRQRNLLESLPVFVAVAEVLSFTSAAKRLGISPSAASQAIRALEERLGTTLFHRSTRSISLTEAGADYFAEVAPALARLNRSAQDVESRNSLPSGLLKLSMPRLAFEMRVAPLLGQFQAAYPDIVMELDIEGRLVDIVKHGFDAGVRHGDFLERDMVAVKISGASEAHLVATPGYLATHAAPSSPTDLLAGKAVACRRDLEGRITPWLLRSDTESVQINPTASVIIHDLVSEIELTLKGMGIGCLPVSLIGHHLASGRLVRVLPEWTQPLEPLFLYFPSQRRKSSALRAFSDFLQSHPEATAGNP